MRPLHVGPLTGFVARGCLLVRMVGGCFERRSEGTMSGNAVPPARRAALFGVVSAGVAAFGCGPL
ncbi:hypothetical protein T484DRAFT_1989721, partial [Baffinella frigidus]